MRKVIRLGDPNSHGGRVTSVAASQFTVDGIPVARVGDTCSCPLPGHTHCVIIEGNPYHTVDGIPVAYEGHKTSCGAELQASAGNFSAS